MIDNYYKTQIGVTLVTAFVGIISGWGPEVFEKTGFPLPRE
jgi:hypothetical protein